MRVSYWSNSKFAERIRNKAGYSKPHAETLEGWDEWKRTNAKKHRFIHWFTDEFLDDLQDVVHWIPDRLHDIRYYVKARWFDKYWCMDTKLKRGQYYEVDTRMLHGMFETLVDFVECEKAHMTIWLGDKGERPLRYRFPLLRWASVRSRELGMKYLEWEMSLDSSELPENERVPLQAEAARETVALYTWWKDVRPTRPDPMDASGWTDYCKSRRSFGALDLLRSNEDKRDTHQMLDRMHEMEKQYDDEDEEMMIRLIKLRKHLWT